MPPIQEDVHACTMCGYCVPVCPAYQEAGWEGTSPRGRIFALRQYEMRGPLDLLLRRHVKPSEEFARNEWECTGCGACEEVCPVDIPFDRLWDDVKAWMVSSGYARPELEPYLANVRATHNLYGEPAANRAAWLPPETVQSPTPEVIYWVGCAASYKKQQIARAMVKILNAAKVPYRILGSEEWCTGAPLARMGYEDVTKKELMPHNVQAVEETGAKVLEILPHHEDALCSGAGGGFPAVFPEQAARVAERRLDAAEDTGAPSLVTTCPHAELHFEDVASKRNMALSIVDLAEMLANAL